MSLITYSIDERQIVTINLDRDEKRNALNEGMASEVLLSLEKAEQDGARAVILRANPGVKVWCAGHDVAELDPHDLHAENPTLAVARKIQAVPYPVIAMVEGSVHGGGLILLLCVDLVIAADGAEVAIASNKLGIPLSPDLHAFWLRVMGIHKAKELLFTAGTITADDALRTGLYNHVVPQGQLERFTLEIARKVAECSPEAIASTKRQLNQLAVFTGMDEQQQADISGELDAILRSRDTQDRITGLLKSLNRDSSA